MDYATHSMRGRLETPIRRPLESAEREPGLRRLNAAPDIAGLAAHVRRRLPKLAPA